MLEDILKESSFTEVVAEWVRPQIEAEMRPKVEAEGMRKLAQVALEGRFGPLAEDVLAALNQADEDTLKALAAHITTDSLEQMRARLGLGSAA